MNLEARVREAVDREAQGVLNSFQELQKDAQTVVRLQQKLEVQVDHTLLLITRVDVPEQTQEVVSLGPTIGESTAGLPKVVERSVEPVAEQPKSRREEGNKVGGAKRRAKAQKELEEFSLQVLGALDSTGPMTLKELVPKFPGVAEYKISKALQYMKKQGAVFHRTLGYQGSTTWYSALRPLYQCELENCIGGLSKGEVIPSGVADHFNLKESVVGVVKMLREMVDKGELVKREGKFYKETPQLRASNGKKDHKANFGGAGVATSGNVLSSNKEVREMIAKAKAKGAIVEQGGKHIKVSFMGKSTTISVTPNSNGLKADRENLKKLGLNV